MGGRRPSEAQRREKNKREKCIELLSLELLARLQRQVSVQNRGEAADECNADKAIGAPVASDNVLRSERYYQVRIVESNKQNIRMDANGVSKGSNNIFNSIEHGIK